MRNQDDVTLGPGELFVVPRGMENQPVAEEETHPLLIEPIGTPNTGDEETAPLAGRYRNDLRAISGANPAPVISRSFPARSRKTDRKGR